MEVNDGIHCEVSMHLKSKMREFKGVWDAAGVRVSCTHYLRYLEGNV